MPKQWYRSSFRAYGGYADDMQKIARTNMQAFLNTHNLDPRDVKISEEWIRKPKSGSFEWLTEGCSFVIYVDYKSTRELPAKNTLVNQSISPYPY